MVSPRRYIKPLYPISPIRMVQALHPYAGAFSRMNEPTVTDINADMVPFTFIKPQDDKARFLRFLKPNPPPAFFLLAHGLADPRNILTRNPELGEVYIVAPENLFCQSVTVQRLFRVAATVDEGGT